MACAYHDDTMTAEELILSTYSRGKAVLDSNLQPGAMAAVGVGYKAVRFFELCKLRRTETLLLFLNNRGPKYGLSNLKVALR